MKIKIKIQVHSITDNNLGLILTKLHLFLCKSMKDVFFNHKLRFTYWMRFFWCMRAFCKALHLNLPQDRGQLHLVKTFLREGTIIPLSTRRTRQST